MTADTHTSWALPDLTAPFSNGPGRSDADFATWSKLIAKVRDIAMRQDWSKAEAARQIGLPDGTFHGWYAGSYNGRFDRTNEKVAAWLEAHAERAALVIPASPPFMETAIGAEITDMLAVAQVMPALVMATAGAGMGKTTVAQEYCDTHPHCHLVTISPHTRTVHAMLMEIADTIGVRQHNPGRLVRALGEKLRRTGGGTLLIVDEAQNLVDDAVNQLRHFVDVYQCGVAILGNTETYSRFSTGLAGGVKYAQLRRRFFKRMRRETPRKDDLATFIAACDIVEPDQVRFLTGVGMKPGAFGQIDMTVKLAKMLAAGAGRAVSMADLRAAWENRDVEGLT